MLKNKIIKITVGISLFVIVLYLLGKYNPISTEFIINQHGSIQAYILEKPTLDYLINTGLYVLEPEVLKYIPVDEFFHITDLIDLLKKKGKKIGVFPIDEAAWVDVGQWAEYREAVKRLN